MDVNEVLELFITADVYPSRYTIKDIVGISPQTLVRRGINVGELQLAYKAATEVGKSCGCCGTLLNNKRNTFCSKSCAALVNNSRRNDIDINLDDEYTVEYKAVHSCKNCGRGLKNKSSIFCSSTCHREHVYKAFIQKWIDSEGNCSNSVSTDVSNYIRRYLFEKHESMCSACGWSKVNERSGKIPLEIEHINGDSTDNSPSNLTLLCPNCHSLTPTYRALNRGKGRHWRMERYRKGKSY